MHKFDHYLEMMLSPYCEEIQQVHQVKDCNAHAFLQLEKDFASLAAIEGENQVVKEEAELNPERFVWFLQDLFPSHTIIDYHTFHQHHDQLVTIKSLGEETSVNTYSCVMVCFPLNPKPHELHTENDQELINLWTTS